MITQRICRAHFCFRLRMKESLILILLILCNEIHGQQSELIAGHVVSGGGTRDEKFHF